MMRDVLTNFVRFVVLVFLQILILNNIQIGSLFVPFLYVWFILRLPLNTPPWLLLILSFGMGLTIDIFSMTLGIHAFSCVLMAMARHLFVKATVPHELFDAHVTLSISGTGFSWFLRYAVVLISVHHLSLFWMESFGWSGLFMATLRALLSGTFTLGLVLLSEFLTTRRR